MRSTAAGVLALAALVAAPAAAQDGEAKRVRTDPPVGKAYTSFVVRFHSQGPVTGFGGDNFWVQGPKGTRCDGVALISTPVGDFEGEQVVRFGPRIKEYRVDGRRYFLPPMDPRDENEEKPLKRWCRGVYHGGHYYEDDDGDDHPLTRFSFRVR